MKKRFYRLCATILIPLMTILNCPVNAVSNTANTIEIEHDGISEVTAGQRIAIEAIISDESGVQTARVYFKAAENADYSFVPLHSKNEEDFTGILPAPANGVGTIEYLILVQNGNNQIFKTQTYMITVEDDDDAALKIAENEKIQVYTELEQAPAEISGFSDNIAIDVVESAAKLGVVAGLYSAAAGNSSSTAVAAGTIIATTGGVSTTAIVVGSVLATGAIATAAISLTEENNEDERETTVILGNWNVNGSHTDGRNTSGTVIFKDNELFNYTFTNNYGARNPKKNDLNYHRYDPKPTISYDTNTDHSDITVFGTGTWSLSGKNLKMLFDGGSVCTGTINKDSRNFTITCSDGWTFNLSR